MKIVEHSSIVQETAQVNARSYCARQTFELLVAIELAIGKLKKIHFQLSVPRPSLLDYSTKTTTIGEKRLKLARKVELEIERERETEIEIRRPLNRL